MRFSDIAHTCAQNLLRRKSRTILTVLGVIVGCCSIVLMISIGQGISEQNEQMLKSMGNLNDITVTAAGGSGAYDSSGVGMSSLSSSDMTSSDHQAKLDDAAVQTFRGISGVAAVMPQRSAQSTVDLTAGAGSRYVAQYASVMGTDMTQLEASGYKLVQGRMPKRAGEVLLGKYAAYQFMDKYRSDDDSRRIAPGDYECDENGCKESEGEKPFFDVLTTKLNLITGADYQSPDDYRKIGRTSMSSTDSGDGDGTASSQNPVVSMPLTVVGVLDASTNNYDAFSSGVVMSLEDMDTLQAKIDGKTNTTSRTKTNYDQVVVHAQNIKDVPGIEAQIKMSGYQTTSFEQTRKEIEKQSRGIQLALGGIGAVSFLVAAIGIANTMIMSVSERTREIGIMKALGCYVKDIRTMFLCEAGAIGLVGGLIACLISALGSLSINLLSFGGFSMENVGKAIMGGDDVSRISVIPWWLFVVAVLFSILVGILAGLGPANKAVKIPALDAIKNEQ